MQGKEKKRKKTASPRGGAQKRSRRYCTFDVRLKAVKLYVEEDIPAMAVAKELGVTKYTITKWAKLYRQKGKEGLITKRGGSTGSRTAPAVKAKITELKKQNPTHGKRRISQILRRIFFIKASPGTVQKTLKEEGLVEKPKKKRKKNPPKPRFFERARPNQMWQSDIFTFRLGGRNAYLIGFMDDYSRYIAGMDVYRSQTAEHVLEVYRRSIAEYGLPREVLTDNGRQYTNWRGKTRFEHELKKDNIRHIRSAPHHPMTLGKIERFWKTVFGEFLSRAQFDSFENARERIMLWIKYYNHRRPHQGIGGLCPADRFFEIQHELKNLIQKGIDENILELALRGKLQDPFYMVGRMGGQSVVIRAEKGKIRMSVDGENETKEMEYPIERKETDNETGEEKSIQDVYSDGEGQGSALDMERETAAVGSVQGAGPEMGACESLAEGSSGGYAEKPGAEELQGQGDEAGDRNPAEEASGEADSRSGEDAYEAPAAAREDTGEERDCITAEEVKEEEYAGEGKEGETPCGGDPEGEIRPDHSQGGSEDPGRIEEDLLPVGEERSLGAHGCAHREGSGQNTQGDRCREGTSQEREREPGGGSETSESEPSRQGGDGRGRRVPFWD